LLSQLHPQLSSSTVPLKTASSHERLLTHNNGQQQQQHQNHFATLAHPPHQHHHHQIAPPAIIQPRPASRTQLPNTSSSYEFVYNAKSVPVNNNNHHHQRLIQHDNQHRLIQPARSAQILIDEETNHDLLNDHILSQQHQSNPNLFHSNQIQYTTINNRNQTFDIPKRTYDHENHIMNGNEHHIDNYHDEREEDAEIEDDDDDDLQPTNFIRSASERQSFGDRNLSTAPPLIFREDIPPPNQNGYINGNHQMKTINHTQSAIGPAIAPKPLPKPMMSAVALIKHTNSVSRNLFENLPVKYSVFVFFSQLIVI